MGPCPQQANGPAGRGLRLPATPSWPSTPTPHHLFQLPDGWLLTQQVPFCGESLTSPETKGGSEKPQPFVSGVLCEPQTRLNQGCSVGRSELGVKTSGHLLTDSGSVTHLSEPRCLHRYTERIYGLMWWFHAQKHQS